MNEDDYRWLGPEALNGQLRVSNAYGAIFSPHVATLQPAKLVRGLARAVERLGVPIYEHPGHRLANRRGTYAPGDDPQPVDRASRGRLRRQSAAAGTSSVARAEPAGGHRTPA